MPGCPSRPRLLRLLALGRGRPQLLLFSPVRRFAPPLSCTLHTPRSSVLQPPLTAPPALRLSASATLRLDDAKKPLSLAEQVMADRVAVTAKEEGKGGGGDGKGEEKKETPRWQKWLYRGAGSLMGGSIIGTAVLFSLPDRDAQGNNIEDEFSALSFPGQHYSRLKNKIFTTKKAIEEPFSDKLLPDPLEAPFFQPKYTVCLEVTGLLVNSDWSHKHGWRFQKRPGLDIFLSQIGYPNFEVVIWSVENSMVFYPIVTGMDPEGRFLMYRLFRDSTRFKDGVHMKDLHSLNRDLKRVIVVDWNSKTTEVSFLQFFRSVFCRFLFLSVFCELTCQHQGNPENALVLPKWTGDTGDLSLISLAQFLQEIGNSDVDDVREVLNYYRQFDDPIEAFRCFLIIAPIGHHV
jgi:import inner membrane translocase subunit TIM50